MTTTTIQVDVTPEMLSNSLISIIGSNYQKWKLFFVPETSSSNISDDDEILFVAKWEKELMDFLHSSQRLKWN